VSDIRDIIPIGETSSERDWFSAHQLSSSLRMGWKPGSQATKIALRPGEYVAHAAPCGLHAYYATKAQARGGSFLAFGSPLLLIASAAGSIGYNMWQNQKAREQAAAQWRYVGSGMAHFTNQRIAVAAETGWKNFEYSSIEATEMEPDGLVIFENGRAREKISINLPLTHFILLRYLAYGEIPNLESSTPEPMNHQTPLIGSPSKSTEPDFKSPAPGLKSTFKN